jgi:hypothetical protein
MNRISRLVTTVFVFGGLGLAAGIAQAQAQTGAAPLAQWCPGYPVRMATEGS